MRVMPVDLGDVNINVPAADWRVALFLVVAAVAATAFFALMPALQATRIEPVRTLRGELVKDARPGRARNALIGVQVFASALLLICAAIFLRSAIASSRFDPGFRTADTVMIELVNEPKRAAMLQAIAAESTITAYAAVRPGMLDQRAGLADTGAGKKNVPYKFVSGAYFDVMGIPILRGRSFTAAEREEDAVVIVSESTARMLWPNRDAVGETFRLEPDMNAPTQPRDEPPLPSRMVTVVGVSRDVTGFRFTGVKGSIVFLPTTLDVPKTMAMARVSGDPDLARQTLLDHLTQDRSEHGHDRDDADRGETRKILPEHRVLGRAHSRIARLVVDGVGVVQRAVVPRRAAHQGDWRANGIGRLVAEDHAVDAVANRDAR